MVCSIFLDFKLTQLHSVPSGPFLCSTKALSVYGAFLKAARGNILAYIVGIAPNFDLRNKIIEMCGPAQH